MWRRHFKRFRDTNKTPLLGGKRNFQDAICFIPNFSFEVEHNKGTERASQSSGRV